MSIDKFKNIIKNKWKWIVLFVCLVGFMAILEDVFEYNIMTMDTVVYKVISNNIISDKVTPIMKFITNFGGAITLITISIISLIVIKNKKMGISICSNLAIIAIMNQIVKHIVQRPRPDEFRIVDESGYSFPSGHSMVSAAFYGFIIYLIYKYVKNRKIKIISIILLGLIIPLIGISRIYLGVHYASDVLAGFLISASYLIVFIEIVNRLLKEKETKNEIKKEEND